MSHCNEEIFCIFNIFFKSGNKEYICYLENVVLDITDLNLLVGVSIWSRGCQQRL